jgi:hypothetical protein
MLASAQFQGIWKSDACWSSPGGPAVILSFAGRKAWMPRNSWVRARDDLERLIPTHLVYRIRYRIPKLTGHAWSELPGDVEDDEVFRL